MNTFEYLVFDLCTAHCNLCFNSNVTNEIYLGECGHCYCIDCHDKLMGTKDTLSSVFYGCSPCPNKCINPRKGIQCHCDEYREVIEAWSIKKPFEYNQWKARLHMFHYKKLKKRIGCPLCIR